VHSQPYFPFPTSAQTPRSQKSGKQSPSVSQARFSALSAGSVEASSGAGDESGTVGDDTGVGDGGARRASSMVTVGVGVSALPRSAPHATLKSRSKLALRRMF
jgi:hypothetical protein